MRPGPRASLSGENDLIEADFIEADRDFIEASSHPNPPLGPSSCSAWLFDRLLIGIGTLLTGTENLTGTTNSMTFEVVGLARRREMSTSLRATVPSSKQVHTSHRVPPSKSQYTPLTGRFSKSRAICRLSLFSPSAATERKRESIRLMVLELTTIDSFVVRVSPTFAC